MPFQQNPSGVSTLSTGIDLTSALAAKPAGVKAQATSNSTQALTNSLADVTSLSASVAFVQNRYYRITFTIMQAPPASGYSAMDARVVVGSTNFDTIIFPPTTTATNRSAHAQGSYVYKHTAASATLTVKVQAMYSGTVSSLTGAAGFLGHQLEVEDIGT